MKFSIDSKEIEFLNKFMNSPRVPRPGAIPNIPKRSGAYLHRSGDELSIVFTPNRHLFAEFDEIKLSRKFDLGEVIETYEVSPMFLVILKSSAGVEVEVSERVTLKDKHGSFSSWNRSMKISKIPGYFSHEMPSCILCNDELMEKSKLLPGKFLTLLDDNLVGFDPQSGSFAYVPVSGFSGICASFSSGLIPAQKKANRASGAKHSIHCGYGIECLKTEILGYEAKTVSRVNIPEDLAEKSSAVIGMAELASDLCDPIEVETKYMLTAIESALKMDQVPLIHVTSREGSMECYFEADSKSVQFLGKFDIGGNEDYMAWSVSPEPILAACRGCEIVKIHLAKSGNYVVCKYSGVSHIIPTSFRKHEEASIY